VIEALKRRASRNKRTLQEELKAIRSSIAEGESPKPPLPPIQLRMSQAPAGANWGREENYGDDSR
jgi:hypothetical protein